MQKLDASNAQPLSHVYSMKHISSSFCKGGNEEHACNHCHDAKPYMLVGTPHTTYSAE